MHARRRRRRHRRRRHAACCDLLRERGFPAAEIVPFACERSAGKELDGGRIVQPLTDETRPGLRRRALLAPAARPRRSGRQHFVAARRDRRRQLVAPSAWTPTCRSSSPRSTPTRSTTSARASSPTRTARRWSSMLPLKALHDAFGLRAMVATSFQAAGGAGQKGMDELAGAGRRRCADVRRSSTTARPRPPTVEHAVHAKTLAFNVVPLLGATAGERLHRRGDEAPERVAQDPRDPGPRRLADLRARAGHGRPRDRGRARRSRARSTSTRALRGARGASRTSSSTTSRRRWSGPAATRSPSAASAATSATRTR